MSFLEIQDPIADDISDMLEEALSTDLEIIEKKIYYKTGLCSCSECKMHKRQEPGWEICPEHSDEDFQSKAVWLWSSMSQSLATRIGFVPEQYPKVEDLPRDYISEYLVVNNVDFSALNAEAGEE